MENKKYGAILYTDGSAIPNPGKYGWGCHGYLFDYSSAGKGKCKPKGFLVTNTGYLDNAEKNLLAGKAVDLTSGAVELPKDEIIYEVTPEYFLDFYGSEDVIATNNVGEVEAIINGGNFILNGQFKDDVRNVIFYSDSKYAIGIVNKMINGTKWNVPDLKNPTLYPQVEDMVKRFKEAGIRLEVRKIKAHDGHVGNESADKLADAGRISSGKEFIVSPNTKYWTPNVERHPLLQFKRIFFNTYSVDRDSINKYIAINYDEEETVGKPVKDASYNLIIPKERFKLVDNLQSLFNLRVNTANNIFVGVIRLDNIYAGRNKFYFNLFKDKDYSDYISTFDKGIKGLSMLDTPKTGDLVYNIDPPGLSMSAMKNAEYLEMIYTEYLKFKNGNIDTRLNDFVDITDEFFDDKKLLKKEFIKNYHRHKYTYNDTVFDKKYKINLVMGTDMLARNVLKKYDKNDVKIYLYIKKFNKAKIEFSTIVENKTTGDLVLTTNFFGNFIF